MSRFQTKCGQQGITKPFGSLVKLYCELLFKFKVVCLYLDIRLKLVKNEALNLKY